MNQGIAIDRKDGGRLGQEQQQETMGGEGDNPASRYVWSLSPLPELVPGKGVRARVWGQHRDLEEQLSPGFFGC